MKKTIKRCYHLGSVALKGNRLYLIHNLKKGQGRIELDITSVWHFFKEVEKYTKEPFPLENNF